MDRGPILLRMLNNLVTARALPERTPAGERALEEIRADLEAVRTLWSAEVTALENALRGGLQPAQIVDHFEGVGVPRAELALKARFIVAEDQSSPLYLPAMQLLIFLEGDSERGARSLIAEIWSHPNAPASLFECLAARLHSGVGSERLAEFVSTFAGTTSNALVFVAAAIPYLPPGRGALQVLRFP